MHGAGPRHACSAGSGNGLDALLRLVEDARRAVGAGRARPVLLGLQPIGADIRLQSAMEAGWPPDASRRPRSRASRFLVKADGGPPPIAGDGSDEAGIGDEHVQVWRLVRLAQNGDGEAFGMLYDRYVDLVFRFIYYRVNDRTLAEDFTSETFLRALRRIGGISYQGRDVGAWFVTIARNIVLDHLKSARTRLESPTGDPIEAVDRQGRVQSTESAVLDSLQSEQLMAAVNKLGDEQRECIVLRFVQGLSVSETAAIMGKNDGAIKALQHRAVRKLADLVGDGVR